MDFLALKTAYQNLSADQKVSFCDFALGLLHERNETEIFCLWFAEAKKRLAESDANPSDLISAKQVLADLRHGI